MTKMLRLNNLCLVFFLFLGLSLVNGQNIPERPKPAKLVNDLADVLTDDEEYTLEAKLRSDMDSTSTQIVVVTIKSVGEYVINDVALKILREWGVGQKGKDNGVVILAAMQDRKIWISTGYGVEGALPDLLCKRIIDQYIKPNFKKSNYAEGFSQAIDGIHKALRGEFKAEPKDHKGDTTAAFVIMLIVLAIIFLIIFIIARVNRARRDGVLVSKKGWDDDDDDPRNRGGGYTPPFIFWGGGGGGGGGDDSGGGGFGGFDFGGGDGGGGGAGGDW